MKPCQPRRSPMESGPAEGLGVGLVHMFCSEASQGDYSATKRQGAVAVAKWDFMWLTGNFEGDGSEESE